MTNIEAVRKWLRTYESLSSGRHWCRFSSGKGTDLFGGQCTGTGDRKEISGWIGGKTV